MTTQTISDLTILHAGEVCPLSSDSPADVQGTAPNSQDSIPLSDLPAAVQGAATTSQDSRLDINDPNLTYVVSSYFINNDSSSRFTINTWFYAYSLSKSLSELQRDNYSDYYIQGLYAGELAQPSPSPVNVHPSDDVQGAATKQVQHSFESSLPIISEQSKQTIFSFTDSELESQIRSHQNFLKSHPEHFCSFLPHLLFEFDRRERAGELAAVQGAATTQDKGFVQSLLNGVYDVAVQIAIPFKKPAKPKTIPDSVPVQITLFELLKPYAQVQYQNMVALLKSCVSDLEQLKNPLSRLSKILGKKRESKIDVLAKQVPAMSRDVVNYQVMWGL